MNLFLALMLSLAARTNVALLHPKGSRVALVYTAVSRSAPAGNAAGAGSGSNATTTIQPVPNVAAGAGAASVPAPLVAPLSGNAAGTGTAVAPQVTVVLNPTVAAGTGQAFGPTSAPAPPAAAGSGAAFFDVTGLSISATLTATVEIAGYGNAFDATVSVDESHQGTLTFGPGGSVKVVSV